MILTPESIIISIWAANSAVAHQSLPKILIHFVRWMMVLRWHAMKQYNNQYLFKKILFIILISDFSNLTQRQLGNQSKQYGYGNGLLRCRRPLSTPIFICFSCFFQSLIAHCWLMMIFLVVSAIKMMSLIFIWSRPCRYIYIYTFLFFYIQINNNNFIVESHNEA